MVIKDGKMSVKKESKEKLINALKEFYDAEKENINRRTIDRIAHMIKILEYMGNR